MTNSISEKPILKELGHERLGPSMKDWSPPPFPFNLAMTGRYRCLDPLKASQHAQDLWNAQAEDTTGATWTYLPNGPYESVEAFKKWLKRAEKSNEPQHYAIFVDGHAAECLIYVSIETDHCAVEVGVYFSPSSSKTHAATEAMFLVASNAFKLGYRRFSWNCGALHVESRNAATRFGFTVEGRFRQALVLKGLSCDTMWFSIIDSDWNNGLKGAYERWLESDNFDEAGQQKLKLSELTAPFVHTRP